MSAVGGAGVVPGIRPVALEGHAHDCPLHGPGVIVTGSSTCKIRGIPVARIGDTISCGATIITGSKNAKIDGGRPIARLGDLTDHEGIIIEGEELCTLE